jgi:hypothetical protein
MAAAALIVAGATISACSPGSSGGTNGNRATSSNSSEEGGRLRDGRWVEGITSAWMSEHMRFEVPATAQDAQAAYQVTSQFDTGILTFTLTRAEADAYLKKHPPSGKWLTPTATAQPTTRSKDFTHLGLPEPETLTDGVRYGDACPGGPEDLTNPYDIPDENCSSLYAHEYAPDRTRIYLRTHFEPGISPLPTPSAKGH